MFAHIFKYDHTGELSSKQNVCMFVCYLHSWTFHQIVIKVGAVVGILEREEICASYSQRTLFFLSIEVMKEFAQKSVQSSSYVCK